MAESAGSEPAQRVNPFAIEALKEVGIDWQGHQPRGLADLDQAEWDIVITVCDRAQEACPVFPGQPVQAHWSMEDPAAAEGDDEVKRQAFRDALRLISRRIDRLLALPVEQLDPSLLRERVQAIGA